MGGVCAQISQRLDGLFHILVIVLHHLPPPPHPAGRTQKEPVLAGPTSFASFPVTSAIWHCANLLGLTLPSRAVVPRAVPEILLVLQREPGLSQVL